MTTTQPLAGSSFTLGDRQNRALTIDAGNVKITSISVPEKHVTLTTKRWARFMSIREEVDIEAWEVNRDASGGLSCTHWRTILRVRDLWVWICWHWSFLRSMRACKENVRPTRNGIGLRLDEWAHLLELLLTIHEQHPELKVNVESSEEETDNKQ